MLSLSPLHSSPEPTARFGNLVLQVTLFGKPDCHLCEDTERVLRGLNQHHPHTLTVVDITRDAATFEQYRYRIPVIAAAGRELDPPHTPRSIAAFLDEASRA